MKKAIMMLCLMLLCGCAHAPLQLEEVPVLSVVAVPDDAQELVETVFFRSDQKVDTAQVSALEGLEGEHLGTPAVHTVSLQEVEDETQDGHLYMVSFYVNTLPDTAASYSFDGVWLKVNASSTKTALYVPGEHRLRTLPADAFVPWRDGQSLSSSDVFMPDAFLEDTDVLKRIETLDGRVTVDADASLPCSISACGGITLSFAADAPYEAYSGNLRIIWEREGEEHSAVVPIVQSWNDRYAALDIQP